MNDTSCAYLANGLQLLLSVPAASQPRRETNVGKMYGLWLKSCWASVRPRMELGNGAKNGKLRSWDCQNRLVKAAGYRPSPGLSQGSCKVGGVLHQTAENPHRQLSALLALVLDRATLMASAINACWNAGGYQCPSSASVAA